MLRAVGEALAIEEVAIAEPGPHEVLIRVAAAGLCHSDVRFMEGSYRTTLPAVLGHESAGVVEQIGPEVSEVAPGDHVITSLSVFCGSCSYCLNGRQHLCDGKEATRRTPGAPPRLSTPDGDPLHQFLDLASFAERMLVHQHALVRIAREMPLDRAALLGCGVATGLGAVFNTAGVGPGESVAVIGCGGVGLAAVQAAQIAGASPIVAIDRIEEKLELARVLGATHGVDADIPDPVAEVRAITEGRGVDHALEAIGSVATAEMAFEMLRRGGTATVIGLVPEGQTLTLPASELLWEKRIQGSLMGSNQIRADLPRYVDMYLDGRLNLDDMVTERLGLEDINQGFTSMKTGRVARNLVVFDEVP